MSKPREWHLADDATIWEATEQGARVICRCEDLDEDAAMIRACPKLLAACEALTAWWGEDGETDMDRLCRTWEDAFAAVAEARGQS